MLKWLGGGKPDHPMHSVKAAEKILSELAPADAEQALDEVCGYLESVAKEPGFKPDVRAGVLQALDDYGRQYQEQLIEQYLGAARIHDLKSRERCQKAYEFWSALSAAYSECLARDFPLEKGKRYANEDLVAQLVCRGVRAGAAQERVRHLAYQAVDKEVWTRLCGLYEVAERAGLEARRVQVYKTDPNTMTAVQEALEPLMLEMGAPESLSPEHVELAARTVASVATSFAVGREPSPALPFCIDLAKPARPGPTPENPPAGARMRYFGPGQAIAKLDELLRIDDTGRANTERGKGTEFTAWDRITVLNHLKRYWGPNRPSRRTGRTRAQGDLSVLHSLDAIRTVAAQVGTDQMDAIAETAKERKQELRLVPENIDLTPETWAEKDSSASGVGAEVPSQRGRWVKVGRLCAMKGADYNNWWVGVIRRLDAPSGRVLAGIQVLTKTPYSLWLKKVGLEGGGGLASNWATSSGSMRYDYVDAVLLVPESEAMASDPVLVMRPEDYKPNMVCEALMGDKSRLIKFGNTVETGDDFTIVSCKWTS